MTTHPSLRTIAQPNYPWKRFPWRAPVMEPPHEWAIPLEVAVLCECESIYDRRVGRCPRCAATADHALELRAVLNRGADASPRSET